MTTPDPELTESLLRAPLTVAAADGRRWAYKPFGLVLCSLFILYHVIALLQHTTPSGGLAANFSRSLAEKLRVGAYMRATSNIQSWSMFAPNPHRSNMFLQVFVELADGSVYDLQHDMYGRREYPYVFYDRMGKINRRLLEQDRYQRHYAAWVCRDWALHHNGEAPVRVKFVKMWTKVPHPAKVIPYMGFDPMQLKLTKEHLPSVECASTVHAQLPDEVRARHGLPPLAPGEFRDAIIQTWHDKAEQREKTIERRRALMPDEPPLLPVEGGPGAEGGE
ncbi:hypothetical protein [Nannocystis sp.]|uniref:hypothetical protein n=1 Tax=Nannocystis sp. TaxID=1962667 RepID=UPI0025DBB1FA|nr:hypothetical protein [Nannocystis sp.]MBK7824544.1 hypothetical protein [Nannocystis sp.]